MVACDFNGKVYKLSGVSEDIIRWLASGGNVVFGAPNLQGAITFNFHTGNEKSPARVTPVISGVASPPGTIA
jgi:hypothetical protein